MLSLFLLFPFFIFGQYYKVKGIVTDSEDNPISRVSITPVNTVGTEISGITSDYGLFEIIMPTDTIYAVEHISYETQLLTLNDIKERHFHIKLEEKVELLDTISISCNGFLVKESNELKVQEQNELTSNDIFQKDFELGITKNDSFEPSDIEELIQIHTYYAEFPGGNTNMLKTIYEKLRPFVHSIRNNNKPVHLKVLFTVNELGYCRDIQLIEKTNTVVDNLVFDMIQALPLWKPAMQFGKPISTKFILPFTFIPNCDE